MAAHVKNVQISPLLVMHQRKMFRQLRRKEYIQKHIPKENHGGPVTPLSRLHIESSNSAMNKLFGIEQKDPLEVRR